MSKKEKIQSFIYRIKIFLWYLITEPMRQIKEIWIFFMKMLAALNKTLTWTYIASVFMIISLFLGKKVIAALFLLFLLFVILLWEWQSGNFMNKHRKMTKKRLEEELKKNGRRKQNGREPGR